MASKSVPISVRVAIYYRLLNREPTESLASEFEVSPTAILRYANDALVELRASLPSNASRAVRSFVFRTMKYQMAKADPEILSGLIEVVETHLESARKARSARKERAHFNLSTRVTRTTFKKFNEIVEKLGQVRAAGASNSELLREIVEIYTESATIPISPVQIKAKLTLAEDIATVLRKHGFPA